MQKLVSKLDELVAAAKDLRENSKKIREIDSSPDKYGELGDHRRSHARWLRHAEDVLTSAAYESRLRI